MQQCIFRVTEVWNTTKKMFSSPCGYSKDTTKVNANDDDPTTLCICEVITPVIRFCQFFGLFPVTFRDVSSHHHNSGTRDNQLFSFHDEKPLNERNYKNWILGRVPPKKRINECHISCRWISAPSITNILLMLTFAGVTTWAFSKMNTIITVYFEGTDLYTFGTQTICLYTQSNFVLINTFLQRERFCEIWALLLKILKKLVQKPSYSLEMIDKRRAEDRGKTQPLEDPVAGLLNNFAVASVLIHRLENNCASNSNNSNQQDRLTINTGGSSVVSMEKLATFKGKNERLRYRFKLLRFFSYFCIGIILILSISHIIAFFSLVFHACFDKTADPGTGVVFGKPPCPLNNFLLFLQKCFYGMIDFVKQGVAILFGTLCLIIYIFFRELEEQLERVLDGLEENLKSSVPIQSTYQLQHLRLCYDDLCRSCRLMSQCFGLAIISVLITSVVSITCALYSFALYSGALETESTLKMARFYVIWAFHGWFGCFCLFLILIPAQMITNASEAPSQVIARHSLAHLDKETKYQISQFQHQSRQPVVLTACNVANVGLGFISAAATNVTTYILVILQFRLGVEKPSYHSDAYNHTPS